ncbi:hypothetical protein VdG1_03996 [Verticillium dahliae VDG1]|nr:hypothetical protein VdG1_03996 [Verticillium dahliae VDG1]
MPVVANYLVPDRQVARTLTAQVEASSTAALPPPAPPLPVPEANFIPLYVLLAFVPLTFLAVGLWACRLERRAARAQASGDIELQTLRTFWFPWREAATTTLPTTIKDWRSVHAALLPHRFGPSSFPGRGGGDDGGPVSPTISAPSFIGSSVVSIGAGPDDMRSSWVSGGAAAPAATPCKVVRFVGEGCEEQQEEDEDDCKGKGKGQAGVQVTTRSVVVSNPHDGKMF